MRRTEEEKEMKRKQRVKRKKEETRKRGGRRKQGGEGEHLTGNIYTVYELAGASNRRGATRKAEEKRRPSTRK